VQRPERGRVTLNVERVQRLSIISRDPQRVRRLSDPIRLALVASQAAKRQPHGLLDTSVCRL
jgi:hypothetical protein